MSKHVFKFGDRVTFRFHDDDEWRKGIVTKSKAYNDERCADMAASDLMDESRRAVHFIEALIPLPNPLTITAEVKA